MRYSKLIAIGTTVAIAGIVIGCGGDTLATLTAEDVDTIGSNAAKALPGCEYNSADVAVSSPMGAFYHDVYQEEIDKLIQRKLAVPLGRTVHEVKAGTCGGTLTTDGTHENGNEDLTYTYDNYCSGDDTKQTVVDGVASVQKDQTPTPSGPELNSATINTEGLTTTNKANGRTTTQTVVMTNVVYTAAKDGAPATLKAEKIKATNDDGKAYEFTNVNVEMKDASAGQPATMEVKSGTYSDPDTGSVSITTTPIAYGDGATGSGTITVKGSEGTAEFKTTDVSTGKFSATMDGKPVGALDCSKNI